MRFAAPVDRARNPSDVVTTFLRWSFTRGVCARGYWLATSIYLVLVAGLSPGELVLVGAAQSATVLAAEVPAGVFADTVSRKWSLTLSALITGTGMVMAGLVTSFPTLTLSQMLWGLGWAFTSGADVAWISDELDRPDLIDRVLTARARWELMGAVAGVIAHGSIAIATSLATSIVLSGVTMLGLGLYVACRFPETRFTPAPSGARGKQAALILRGGVRLARRDREVLMVTAAWLLVNGAGAGYGRLVEEQLIATGLTSRTQAILWITGLSLTILLISAVGLRAIERHIDRPDTARRVYRACCASGVVGLLVFANASEPRLALAAVVLASGVVYPGAVVRAVGEIWINRRTSSDVRATVHSLSSQAEQVGEVVCGVLLALLAQATSAHASIAGSAALLALALLAVPRAGSVAPSDRGHRGFETRAREGTRRGRR
jgi:MFS family permease